MNRKPAHCLIINEFRCPKSPVSRLTLDLFFSINKLTDMKASYISMPGSYSPGGMQPRRVFNFIVLHILMPLIIFFFKVKSIAQGKQLIVIPTTNPPLVHWNAIVACKLFRTKVLTWFQDSHPELECRAFESRGFYNTGKLLRRIDRLVMSLNSGIITLDKAMAARLHNTIWKNYCSIVWPWITYISPAKPIRIPHSQNIRLIYAGNYGAAHDLYPLVQELINAESENARLISITFVGISSTAKSAIRQMFAETPNQISFLPRFSSVEELCNIFENYDYGIVSLAREYAGIACPSKAFTYLSQGLPILYVGPPETLSDELTQLGWGIRLVDFFQHVHRESTPPLNVQEVLPDPTDRSKAEILRTIDDIARQEICRTLPN